jgi:uncharacterized protein (DUF58 family)
MKYDPEVQRALDAYQLGLPRTPLAGRTGELLGRGTGSSIEFQEFRQYLPGDDIRHVDWAAYARSDTLMVRLYREEISPRTEILVDVSRSMNSGSGQKARVTRQLAGLFALLCARLGGRPAVLLLNDQTPLRHLTVDALDVLQAEPFSARGNLAELVERSLIPLKPQSVRIVISDFLFPHDPAALVRRLGAGASALWLVQLLTEWESHPTPLGGRRLIDVETEGEIDLTLDARTIAAYSERLRQLQEELMRGCRRVHGLFATLEADRGLEELCRSELVATGMLRAA